MNLDRLLLLPSDQRKLILEQLSPLDRKGLEQYVGKINPYQKYQDNPVGFVQEALGETLWSKQKEILESVRDNKRTAVPACHAPGKSHIAARAVAWWVSSFPVGTTQVLTTAPNYRQVRTILWSHIQRLHSRHNLQGEVFTTEWRDGKEIMAYGFSGQQHDESVVQGIHAPHLLIVVDEAAGISPMIGTALESLMTGGHTRMLVLGNPPTDNEGTWFERACNSPIFNVLPIGAYDTPNFTGEDSGICNSCPDGVEKHQVKTHLVDHDWVNEVSREFGEDSPFVEARVHARFPRAVNNKTIPLTWIEKSVENEYASEGPIRLGVDIASGGGDEFVVAWADGQIGSIKHRSSGSANSNALDVAGVVLQQILDAESIHKARKIDEKVRVKIDSIGVGWGIVSTLTAWGKEGKHNSVIVPVNVAERASDTIRFTSQRAELWWTGRQLLQPDNDNQQQIRLDVDQRTQAQLSAPTYSSDSGGRIAIEAKKAMKHRGVGSPDRAEALLLAFYEPPKKRFVGNVAPISISQPNGWNL
jgi:hypothetical protein